MIISLAYVLCLSATELQGVIEIWYMQRMEKVDDLLYSASERYVKEALRLSSIRTVERNHDDKRSCCGHIMRRVFGRALTGTSRTPALLR